MGTAGQYHHGDPCYQYLLSEYNRVRDQLRDTQDYVIKLQRELFDERNKRFSNLSEGVHGAAGV